MSYHRLLAESKLHKTVLYMEVDTYTIKDVSEIAHTKLHFGALRPKRYDNLVYTLPKEVLKSRE